MKCRPTKSNITYMDEYIDTDGEKKYRLLMNKFNFTERYSQTFSLSKVRLLMAHKIGSVLLDNINFVMLLECGN